MKKIPNRYFVLMGFSLASASLFLPYFLEKLSFVVYLSISGMSPIKYQIGRCLLSGEYPLWNPYLICGTPFHFGIGILDPFLLVQLFASGAKIILWHTYVALFLAGIFMYVYLRKSWHFSRLVSFLGGALYLSNPFFAAASPEPIFLTPPIYLPLVMMLTDAGIRKQSWFYASSAGLALAMTFFSGNLESYYYCAIFLFVMQGGKVFLGNDASQRIRKKIVSAQWIIWTFVFSLLFIAMDLLPTLEVMRMSYRAGDMRLIQTLIFIGSIAGFALAVVVIMALIAERYGRFLTIFKVFVTAGLFILFTFSFTNTEIFYLGFQNNVLYPRPELLMTHGMSAYDFLKSYLNFPGEVLSRVIRQRFIFYFQHPAYLFSLATLFLFLSSLWVRRGGRYLKYLFFVAVFLALTAYTAMPNIFVRLFHMQDLTFQRLMFVFFFLLCIIVPSVFSRIPSGKEAFKISRPICVGGLVVSGCLMAGAVWNYFAAFDVNKIREVFNQMGGLNTFSDCMKDWWLYLRLDFLLLPIFYKANLYALVLSIFNSVSFALILLIMLAKRKKSWLLRLFVAAIIIQSCLAWIAYTFQKKDIAMLDLKTPEIQWIKDMAPDFRMGVVYDPGYDIRYFYDDQSHQMYLDWNLPLYWDAKVVGASSLNLPLDRFESLWAVEDENSSGIPTRLGGMKTLLYDLMGMKYLFSREAVTQSDYRLLDTGMEYKLYENLKALPRFYQVTELALATDREIREDIRKKQFSPKDKAYLERLKPQALQSLNQSISQTRVNVHIRMLKESFNSVRFIAQSPAPVFLVSTDAFNQNWNVYIDGIKGEIYQCNSYFQGFRLKEGQSLVEFKYEPSSFRLGAVISAFAFLSTLLLFIIERKRRPLAAPPFERG